MSMQTNTSPNGEAIYRSRPGRALAALGLLACTSLVPSGPVAALELEAYPQIGRFIDEMAQEHGFEPAELEALFRSVRIRPEVVKAMQRPAERLPWHRYRRLFVSSKTARSGAEFWRRHHADLERAAAQYGVPPQIVVAIIGVETRYGATMGRHVILDSLTTLTLKYPRRSDFFRRELEAFLLLAREEGLDPLSARGSYAGAMGIPQFIASSYRSYAVDFNGDRRRDLIGQTADAIGSVANYLHTHRWQRDAPIVSFADVDGNVDAEPYLNKGREPELTLERLRAVGVRIDDAAPDESAVGLIRLEQADGYDYRVGYRNFYALMSYNPSTLYAMAVFELSREIAKAYARPS